MLREIKMTTCAQNLRITPGEAIPPDLGSITLIPLTEEAEFLTPPDRTKHLRPTCRKPDVSERQGAPIVPGSL